jgi:hypothetical protein
MKYNKKQSFLGDCLIFSMEAMCSLLEYHTNAPTAFSTSARISPDFTSAFMVL